MLFNSLSFISLILSSLIDNNFQALQSAGMYLITMAHKGEAQGVIEKYNLKKISNELYENQEIVLLITGEGPFEAAIRTALIIPRYSFKFILNLGIAGTISEDCKVGDVISVRTIYLLQNNKPSFKSFQSDKVGQDCLTSFERILDPEKVINLRGLGSIVDREAWGVAMAAKAAGVPFKSYKVVSDQAGTLDACELVRERAYDYSLKLADVLSGVFQETPKLAKKIKLPDGFYFTFTTENRFKTFLDKLSQKHELHPDVVITSLELNRFLELNLTPKEKTAKLLEAMEELIDPLKKVLQQNAEKLTKRFSDHGFKIQIDPSWENPKLKIELEASDSTDLQKQCEKLSQLSLDEFSTLMKGDFHVE